MHYEHAIDATLGKYAAEGEKWRRQKIGEKKEFLPWYGFPHSSSTVPVPKKENIR